MVTTCTEHRVKANLVLISFVIQTLLVCDAVTGTSETEVICDDCHPSDPDLKRNVVSSPCVFINGYKILATVLILILMITDFNIYLLS